MKANTLRPYRAVYKSASGRIDTEEGFWSLHAARRAAIAAVVAAHELGEFGVTVELYRGLQHVSTLGDFDHSLNLH